jgi:hypothetical protein
VAVNVGKYSNTTSRVVGTGMPPCQCGNFSISTVKYVA